MYYLLRIHDINEIYMTFTNKEILLIKWDKYLEKDITNNQEKTSY